MNSPINPYAEYLLKQGLGAEDAQLLKLEYIDAKAVSAHVGFRTRNAGILIPYPDTEYSRVRLLGKLLPGGPKYLSVKGAKGSPVFFPPGRDWNKVKQDVREDLIITEGELKAYTGSKSGPAVVGIGGVDMQAGLFECGIAWKTRRVFICFDKDAGYAAGTYKPDVGRALGKLATYLQRGGATVLVMHIPGEVDTKLGLDDYLNAGGSLNDLAGGAAAPPEWCEDLAWLLENCVYVTGTNNTHIYNLEDGSRKSVEDFHQAHIKKTRVVSEKVQQLSRVWQRDPNSLEAQKYVLDPTRAFGVVGSNPSLINLWRPYPEFLENPTTTTLPDGSVVSVSVAWQHFMEGLFGEYWEWVACWTAHILLRPEEKCCQAVMVGTKVRGIGKSLFGEIVIKLCGVHGLEGRPEQIFDRFNSEMEARTFVLVNELDALFSAKESQFNNLTTSEEYQVEFKCRDKIFIADLRRWYMTFNAAVAMRLTAGQRRFMIVSPPRVEADTRGPWGEWVRTVVSKWKRDPAALGEIRSCLEEVLQRCEERDGRWDPTAPVPETEEGGEMAEASMTGNQILAAEAIKWIKENDGLGAAHPHRVRLKKKAFQEIITSVRAIGGTVGKKTVKEDGKTHDYYVFSIGRDATEWTKTDKRETKSLLEPEAVKSAAIGMWSYIEPILNSLEGRNDTKW